VGENANTGGLSGGSLRLEVNIAEEKTHPKCNGSMTRGRILKCNEHVARNQYVYVFGPDADSAPDLSKMFSGKPMSKSRKALVAYCYEQYEFTELSGQTVSRIFPRF